MILDSTYIASSHLICLSPRTPKRKKMDEDLKLFLFWASPFSKRVEIALKLKGVEYQPVEEDINNNKSEELLKYNPVFKKIPVLVHNGKPIAESLVILEYIDETWKGYSILPDDPYERAQARFLANFIDDQFTTAMRKALGSRGEERAKATEEAYEVFQVLENKINGKRFFGGIEIGYVDIVAIVAAYWFPILSEVAGIELFTKEKFPGICAWIDELLSNSIMKELLPPKDTLRDFLHTVYQLRFSSTSSSAHT